MEDWMHITKAGGGRGAAPPAAESHAQHGTIAHLFQNQYYAILETDPASAHRFYDDESVLSRSDTRCLSATPPVHGLSAINHDILVSGLAHGRTTLESLDHQPTAGGILLVVTGVVLLKGEPRARRFVQTFLLVNRANTYYIRNDVHRLLDPPPIAAAAPPSPLGPADEVLGTDGGPPHDPAVVSIGVAHVIGPPEMLGAPRPPAATPSVLVAAQPLQAVPLSASEVQGTPPQPPALSPAPVRPPLALPPAAAGREARCSDDAGASEAAGGSGGSKSCASVVEEGLPALPSRGAAADAEAAHTALGALSIAGCSEAVAQPGNGHAPVASDASTRGDGAWAGLSAAPMEQPAPAEVREAAIQAQTPLAAAKQLPPAAHHPLLPSREQQQRVPASSYGHGSVQHSGSASVFVSGVPGSADNDELKAAFSRFGAVKQVHWRKERAFAFIDFFTQRDAHTAIAAGMGEQVRARALAPQRRFSPSALRTWLTGRREPDTLCGEKNASRPLSAHVPCALTGPLPPSARALLWVQGVSIQNTRVNVEPKRASQQPPRGGTTGR
jgi:hypothetical protein